MPCNIMHTLLDRVSVPSPIAIDILMVHNGEGQSTHVLVFCVYLELSEIISFTLKSPSYVYTASRHKLAAVISWPPSPNLEITTNLKANCNRKWSIIITFMLFIHFKHCTKTYLSVWPN